MVRSDMLPGGIVWVDQRLVLRGWSWRETSRSGEGGDGGLAAARAGYLGYT